MALTKVRNLASLAVSAPVPDGAQPCEILDDDGSTCHGYEHDGALKVLAVVAPGAALIARLDAMRTAAAAVDTKQATALTVIRNQVTRVRGIAEGSRTPQDRWLMALTYLMFREE